MSKRIPKSVAKGLIRLAKAKRKIGPNDAYTIYDRDNIAGTVAYANLTRIKQVLPAIMADFDLGVVISSNHDQEKDAFQGKVTIFDTSGKEAVFATPWFGRKQISLSANDSPDVPDDVHRINGYLGWVERYAVEHFVPVQVREEMEPATISTEPVTAKGKQVDRIPSEVVIDLTRQLKAHRKFSAFTQRLRDQFGVNDLAQLPVEKLTEAQDMANKLIGGQDDAEKQTSDPSSKTPNAPFIPSEIAIELAQKLRENRKLSAFNRKLKDKLGVSELARVPSDNLDDVKQMVDGILSTSTASGSTQKDAGALQDRIPF